VIRADVSNAHVPDAPRPVGGRTTQQDGWLQLCDHPSDARFQFALLLGVYLIYVRLSALIMRAGISCFAKFGLVRSPNTFGRNFICSTSMTGQYM
jgi:hypothetical protein